MKKYYLHNGTENIGPFSIEELQSKGIKKDTPVWNEEMDNWKEANEVEELRNIIKIIPPPFLASSNAVVKKKSSLIKKFILLFLGAFVIVVFLTILTNINQDESHGMSVAETEAFVPTVYLLYEGSYKENFLGDKLIINGFISNTATVVTYQNAVIEITYYSKTNTVLQKQNFTIFEFFPPQRKIPFKLKIDNYSNVRTIDWKLIDAGVKNE